MHGLCPCLKKCVSHCVFCNSDLACRWGANRAHLKEEIRRAEALGCIKKSRSLLHEDALLPSVPHIGFLHWILFEQSISQNNCIEFIAPNNDWGLSFACFRVALTCQLIIFGSVGDLTRDFLHVGKLPLNYPVTRFCLVTWLIEQLMAKLSLTAALREGSRLWLQKHCWEVW